MSTDLHPALGTGRVAAITGAASGIGLASARRFLGFGMKVSLADSEADELLRVSAALAEEFGRDRVVATPTDVSERNQLVRFRDATVDTLGKVSVLMNNAGTGLGGGVLERPLEWERVLNVNLWGVVYGVQTFVPHMLEHGEAGLVINTGSKQGITCPPGNAPYNVSKAGVKVFTESLQHELRNTPECRVSAHLLVPGWTATSINLKAERDRARLQGDTSVTLESVASGKTTGRASGAWSSDEVVDFMLAGIAKQDFYILCPDNEVTPEMDRKRILWAAQDLTEGRPPLSRWHVEHGDAFRRFAEK